jgi:hypothetical protein
MKKISTITILAFFGLLIACGPTKEEKAIKEKARLDSITKAQKEKKVEDSISIIEQAKQDSIIKAGVIEDSLVKLKAKNSNKKTAVKKSTNKPINKKNIKKTNKKALPKKK